MSFKLCDKIFCSENTINPIYVMEQGKFNLNLFIYLFLKVINVIEVQ